MSARTPHPDPDAPGTPVTIKARSWEPADRTVTLRPARHGGDARWEVYDADGTWIGTVERYTGTLDRPIARQSPIRHIGKRRTLWGHRGTTSDIAIYEQTSRADCLRALLRERAWGEGE